MEVIFTKNGVTSSIVSSKRIQSEIIVNKNKQLSTIESIKDTDGELTYYNKPNNFVYDKLLTEIKCVSSGDGDLWGDLALNYTSDPILLLSNSTEEIYEYINIDGVYFRKLDYVLNTDTFYKNYQNGLLSEKLAERGF